eukprot:jgi/Hompol1/6669/HPOL_000126-RA
MISPRRLPACAAALGSAVTSTNILPKTALSRASILLNAPASRLSTAATTAAKEQQQQQQQKPAKQEAAGAPLPGISVGILLKRNPVVLPELSEFQKAYYAYRQEQEQQDAKPFDHTFYYKKGSIPEQRWLTAQSEAASLPNPGNIKVIAQPAEEELLKLKVAPRTTEADAKGDLKSLDRALQRTLYLVAAEARLKESLGAAMETWFVGKAPVGHFKETNNTVFYMKAHIFSGKVVPSPDIKDHAWMTKEEMAGALEPAYYQQIQDMISDL